MRDQIKETALTKTVSPAYTSKQLGSCQGSSENDTIIVPNDSTWFGFYADDKALHRGLIGLKTLDDAGKVSFVSVESEHLQMSNSDKVKYVILIPYLQNQPSSEQKSFNRKTEALRPYKRTNASYNKNPYYL
uniref:Uncharacterized protein n=1 Tax=Brassica oleracea TaxID=3712 RepID=A0A3P6DNJ9_BRAOL|nr:unnamed protein product [Brassica oleracea]